MIKKPISHSNYEKIMSMSYNDFNRWFKECQTEQKNVAIDAAIHEVKRQIAGDPDADIYSWDADALRQKLSDAGFVPRSVDTIMDILMS